MHELTFAADQVIAALPPETTVVGLAEIERAGWLVAFTVSEMLCPFP
jgi:hypothetical protein